MSFPDPSPLRLLVIRYRFIGDTVLAIPFLRNLRQAFPHAVIDVLAEPVSGETLAHCPYKNELLYFAPRAKQTSPHPRSLLACARMLRARGYDRVYILRRSFSSAILPLLARIPHRVGFATEGRRWLLQRSTPYPDKHEVECFLDILRADGIPVTDTANENWSDPATDARVAAKLPPPGRRRVFVCAKSVFTPKDWSPERFAEILTWLIAERDAEIHFCDSPANAPYYAEILARISTDLHGKIHDWSRDLPIRDVNSLFRHIDLAFGVDTGLLHVAASFHIPVVVMFGPLDPLRWHPWDTAHTVLRPADTSGPQPLLRLSVAEVQSALDAHLPASWRSVIRMPSASSNLARPLVVRFGAFGDMVLMVPILKFLEARFGQPCEVVSSGPWTEPLLLRVPAAAERFYLTSRRAPYWFNRSQQQLVHWLRARPAGPVFVFEPDEKPLSLLRRGGIDARWICTQRDFARLPGEHIIEQSMRVARATPAALAGQFVPSVETPNARPTLAEADRHDCAEWLASRGLAAAPLILLQPGNKKTMKRGSRQRRSNTKFWLEDNWARVIDGLLAAQPTARVLLCGSPAERPLAEDIIRRTRTTGVEIATDDLPIPRLLALQERAHSMISVDTGPAHSAAALGCPLVVLFGSIDPHYYAPLPTTAPVKILRAPDPASEFPLNGIAPETVLAAWLEMPQR